jgi:toxin FitB
MRFLLDTCVISELVRPRPSQKIIQWINTQTEERLFLSVLTLGELTRGISRLAEGQRKEQLLAWVQDSLRERFEGRWLEITGEISETWGQLQATAERKGRPLPVIDALLASTALIHGMTFATRDVSHLEGISVKYLNPWQN